MDKTTIAVGVFNKLAEDYQHKFMNVDLYADTLDFFCTHIKKDAAAVLDIACGPGNITKYVLKQNPEFKITGIDLAPNMLKLAQANNPEAQFQCMDCREVWNIRKAFDGIICGFGLPYLSKEEVFKLIKDVAQLLIPGGLFYLSTMEDEYSKSGLQKGSAGDEIYMHYHEAGYLMDALKQEGFEILKTERKIYMHQGKQTVDLILIAQK